MSEVKYRHCCWEWDGMELDETWPEFAFCMCDFGDVDQDDLKRCRAAARAKLGEIRVGESNTEFWTSSFGDEYTQRNQGEQLIQNNLALFRRSMAPMFLTNPPVARVIEFGANVGLNLRALERISAFSLCEFTAVEPNTLACNELGNIANRMFTTTMTDPERPWGNGYDLAISKGVLIHIHPDELAAAYDALYHASARWIYLAEYHNPKPVQVEYRGHTGKLWKRDFAAEMLEAYPLRVIDYGFAWKHDPRAPQDDLVWTLLERIG